MRTAKRGHTGAGAPEGRKGRKGRPSEREAVVLMRTGSEPRTARSPLRMRLWLSVWGVIWAVLGTVAFALVGRPGWAAVCDVVISVG
jgi:hypothetical protein